MQKTILITGSTDGIGLEAAKKLVAQGHKILLHGRSKKKLNHAQKTLSELSSEGNVETYLADLSDLEDVETLAEAVTEKHNKLDVLINNAGVFRAPSPIAKNGLDVRFVVNTIAPYLLVQKLIPLFGSSSRVINLSSAAQSPVNPEALLGRVKIEDDFDTYAQSKLALTMWSHRMGLSLKENGPIVFAVNPGSLLATKMVKEGFGMPGKDINIGANILARLALDAEFSNAFGQYFDNDVGQLTSPHPDCLNAQKCDGVIRAIEIVLSYED